MKLQEAGQSVSEQSQHAGHLLQYLCGPIAQPSVFGVGILGAARSLQHHLANTVECLLNNFLHLLSGGLV